LDELLSPAGSGPLPRLEFSRRTADVLGPPPLSEEVQESYLARCQELFGPAGAEADDEQGGFASVLVRWKALMTSVGRRGGMHLQKQVLDILSYEARAALHRCYSAVWCGLLLPHLAEKYGLSAESVRFLSLWHLDQVSESNLGDQAYFHLFHGHVFALHPAAALFLSTPRGQGLVGSWLADGGTEAAFGRFLAGMLVAVHHYDARREQSAADRKKRPTSTAARA